MIKTSKNFIIEYSKNDENLIEELITYLEENILEICKFFEILPKEKIKINIIETKEKLDQLLDNPKEWITGFINSNTKEIYKLSFNDYKNTPHKTETIKDFKKTVIHECVHIINSISSNNNLPITPIWEGVACYLSKQYDKEDNINITLDELLSGDTNFKNYYIVFKQLVKELNKETLLNIINSKIDAIPYIEEILNKSKNTRRK